MKKVMRLCIMVVVLGVVLCACATIFDTKHKKEYVVFSGYVMSPEDKPINAAQVEVNGASVRTNAKGYFGILVKVKDSKRYVMNIRKPGFGLVSRVFRTGIQGSSWTMPKATTLTVDPRQTIFVQDRKRCVGPLSSRVNWNDYPRQKLPRVLDQNGQMIVGQYSQELEEAVKIVETGPECTQGISIRIPANSLVNMSGNPPGGNVQVAVSTVDLFAPDEMPGDFTVQDESGKTMYMRSTGAGTVEASAKGRPYQLKKGTKAILTIPIDPTILRKKQKPDPTIPLLLYDEKNGVWRPKGIAKLNEKGNAYVAEIDHLSTFNMDIIKTDPSCVKFQNAGISGGNNKLEVIIPGESPREFNLPGLETGDVVHAVINVPNNTNITLRPFKVEGTDVRPLGTYLADTGPPYTGPTPPQDPYDVCEGIPVWDMYEIILEVTNVTENSIRLAWTEVPNVSEYWLILPPVGGLGTTPIPINPTQTTYDLTGLNPDTTYGDYQIEAQLYATPYVPGTEAISNKVSATTLPSTVVPPSAPTNLQASATSSSSIQLTWTDTATNEDRYSVGRRLSLTPTFADIAPALPPDTEGYTDTGLNDSTYYDYNVRAHNTAGDSVDTIVTVTTGCNIVDTWNGTGSETLSGCDDAGTDGTYGFNVTVTIASQTPDPDGYGDLFTGSTQFTGTGTAAGYTVAVNLNGTINPNGDIDGSFTSDTYYNAAPVSSSAGTFDGSVQIVGCNGITVNFVGDDTYGDTCHVVGNFNVTR